MKPYITLLSLFLQLQLFAQESFIVTDTTPVSVNGLKAGYTIEGEKEKEVGNKGNFSRYQVQFYVTNTGNEAKILLHKQGFVITSNGVAAYLAQFRCSNATGARMTSKEWTLQAKPCILEALVDEPDPASNKTIPKRRLANIGFWIRPGETIMLKNVVIVPLNEKPSITVSFFPGNFSTLGSVVNPNQSFINYQNTPQGFIRIKNLDNNNYLHNQDGPAACTTIDMNWWSAQWEILPVNGTGYYNIRNRWKNNFLSTENGNMLSDKGQLQYAMWQIENTGNGNSYTIKNVANNLMLVYQNGRLTATSIFGTPVYALWAIEQ